MKCCTRKVKWFDHWDGLTRQGFVIAQLKYQDRAMDRRKQDNSESEILGVRFLIHCGTNNPWQILP